MYFISIINVDIFSLDEFILQRFYPINLYESCYCRILITVYQRNLFNAKIWSLVVTKKKQNLTTWNLRNSFWTALLHLMWRQFTYFRLSVIHGTKFQICIVLTRNNINWLPIALLYHVLCFISSNKKQSIMFTLHWLYYS